jgi:MerR family transcriptional regulator, light-induced transcriptional regulator
MKPSLTPEFISTVQAAEALGVSVSTVKRWVEDGILPAQKTVGGHRKLLLADVVEIARQGKLPVRDLAGLKLSFSKDQPPSPKSLAEHLYPALLAGDASAICSILHGAYQSGMPIETLADQVIAPAMQLIGSDWETGKIDVMHEHRASQLCASALFELKAVLERRSGRNRPLAVGGALEGDFTVLPSLLAQMVLLDSGWDAVNLGPNTPVTSFRKALEELKPRLMWISLSHLQDAAAFVRSYRELYDQSEQAGIAVVIGGRALEESVRASIPYTAHGDTLSHLAAFARSLHPRPRRPRRGRPPGT